MNTREAIGVYEFSMFPQSRFAADETWLLCSAKSALVDILEALPIEGPVEGTEAANEFAHADFPINVFSTNWMGSRPTLRIWPIISLRPSSTTTAVMQMRYVLFATG